MSKANSVNDLEKTSKSWIKTNHKEIYDNALSYESNFNEFCFKLNRSQWKDILFHSAIGKVVVALPLLRRDIPTKADFQLA